MLFDELFLEGPDYQNMFNTPVLKTGSVNTYIQSVIQKAKTSLVKNDRVVWFLRLFRLQELQKLKDAVSKSMVAPLKLKPGEDFSKKSDEEITLRYNIDQLLQQYLFRYKKAAGYAPDPSYILGSRQPIEAILPKLEHLLSLPIPEIQDTIFTYQNPVDLMNSFFGYEKKWQESRKGMISANDSEGATVVLTFPNGFAWYNLNKAYCSKEADAMGHCGNEPRADSGDTILSLRQTTKKGKQSFFVPYCTFILLEDDTLGEMKGRFNNSPKNAARKGYAPSDFSDEIFALLKLPMIKGITGGGYMPQENFKVNDLRPEQIEELEKTKPNLMPLMYQYKKYGAIPRVIEAIETRTNELGEHKEYDPEEKAFIWDYETSLYNFAENHVQKERNSNGVAIGAIKQLENGGDFYYDGGSDKSSKDEVLDDLRRKNPKWYANLERYVTKLWIEENPKDDDEDDYDDDMDLIDMIDELSDQSINDALDTAVRDGHERGAENEMYEYFNKWLDSIKSGNGEFRIALPEWDEKHYDGKVLILVEVEHLISMLDDGSFEEYEGGYEADDMGQPYHGFSEYDDDAALDYFTNEMHDILTDKAGMQEWIDQGT